MSLEAIPSAIPLLTRRCGQGFASDAVQSVGLHFCKQARAGLSWGCVLHEGLGLSTFRTAPQGMRRRSIPAGSLLVWLSPIQITASQADPPFLFSVASGRLNSCPKFFCSCCRPSSVPTHTSFFFQHRGKRSEASRRAVTRVIHRYLFSKVGGGVVAIVLKLAGSAVGCCAGPGSVERSPRIQSITRMLFSFSVSSILQAACSKAGSTD